MVTLVIKHIVKYVFVQCELGIIYDLIQHRLLFQCTCSMCFNTRSNVVKCYSLFLQCVSTYAQLVSTHVTMYFYKQQNMPEKPWLLYNKSSPAESWHKWRCWLVSTRHNRPTNGHRPNARKTQAKATTIVCWRLLSRLWLGVLLAFGISVN